MDEPKNIFGDIERAREEMEQLMRQVFGPTMPLLRPAECKWRPNVDVFECENSIVIVIELAGVMRDEVSVIYHDGKLHINGVRRDGSPYKNRKYCQMEINYNEFERVIYMPDNIDPDGISAKMNNGLMTVEAPKKKPEPPRSHKVEIG